MLQTVASGKGFEDCIEMIDIGGPTMVRAAAKNCDSVAIITSPSQYTDVIAELEANNGTLAKTTRRRLARDAFLSTAEYDFSAYSDMHLLIPHADTIPLLLHTFQRRQNLQRSFRAIIFRTAPFVMASTHIRRLLRTV